MDSKDFLAGLKAQLATKRPGLSIPAKTKKKVPTLKKPAAPPVAATTQHADAEAQAAFESMASSSMRGDSLASFVRPPISLPNMKHMERAHEVEQARGAARLRKHARDLLRRVPSRPFSARRPEGESAVPHAQQQPRQQPGQLPKPPSLVPH